MVSVDLEYVSDKFLKCYETYYSLRDSAVNKLVFSFSQTNYLKKTLAIMQQSAGTVFPDLSSYGDRIVQSELKKILIKTELYKSLYLD